VSPGAIALDDRPLRKEQTLLNKEWSIPRAPSPVATSLPVWTNLDSAAGAASDSASAVALSSSVRFADAPVRIKAASQEGPGATS
jgi:hypothetical protein